MSIKPTIPDNPDIEVVKAGKTGLFTNYIFKAIPLAFDESMSYYETLCGLLNYLKNTIIPTVNNNADAVAELQTLYEELRTFVDDYFTNLNVQEEINNKLDAMVEDGTLPEIIASYLNSKAIFGYDTVASMKQATNLINGSYAKTLGYYEVNDGGNATYKIRKITNEDVVDEASIISLADKTLIAELIINDNQINVKQFGCKGDGITDDTTNLQKALNSNADKIYLNEGNYLISDTIVLPLNKTLYGCNGNTCVIKCSDFDDYAIKYGDTYKYENKRGKLENLRIESNNNDNHTYGLYLNSGLEIRNVYFNKLKQAISKVNNYIDNLVIYRCHIMYCGGKENSYIVDLPSNGDAVLISQCQFNSAYTTENYNDYLGIKILGSTGVLLENNIINVPIRLQNCTATLLNNHMEGPSTVEHFNLSNIKIYNSNVLIDTLFIHKCINKPEIAIQDGEYNEVYNSNVTLKNINIWLTSLMFKNYKNMENMYDLFVGRQCVVNIENVFNLLDYSAVWSSARPITGIKVKNDNGDLTDFNIISSLASIKSTISFNKVYINNLQPVNVNASNSSLQYSAKNTYTPWFENGYNNNSVFYKRVSCYDFDRKLIASISNEKEVTGITSYVSDSNIGVGSNINNILNFMNETVGHGLLDIIYRGDSTGSYNKITKIPVCCARALYDFGTHICGYPTESREAGDIDNFNVVTNFKRIGNNVEFTASATPTYGTFVKGDRCINSSINTGNVKSWIYNGSNWISEGEY